MSDLRDALDRESKSFDLAPGALERMLDRQRSRTQRRRIGAAVVGLVITGAIVWAAVSLGGLENPSRPATRPGSPLEGTWQSGKLSEPDIVRRFVAAGGTAREGRAFFSQLGGGAERYAVITLRFEDGSFVEFESGDGGPPVTGYEATYAVSRGDVLTISSPRCTGTYSFSVRAGRFLRLTVIHQCARHDGVYNTTLFASFPLTKQD
jgi:hypothetical protein